MIAMLRTPRDHRWYRLAVGTLVLCAWAVLAMWSASPFAGLLNHRQIGESSLSPILGLAVFVVGWTLMTMAMMLPGSLPLVNLFTRMVVRRPDRTMLVGRLLAGYLGIWALFGAAAYLGDTLIHGAVRTVPEVAAVSNLIGVAVLLIAGVYQVTPLKRMCLDKCRSPYSFLVEHWRGRHHGRDAVWLGVRHGLFCVGCCWTVMLLMFAIGGINLGWMLALGAAMAAERAFPWGRHLTVPVALLLVLCGLGLVYRIPLVMTVFGAT